MDGLHTIKITPLSRKFGVLLLVAASLALMGAKWVEKPIESLESISGKWKGGGITATGYRFEVEYVFKADGAYDAWTGGQRHSGKSQRPPGTVRLIGGKLEYKNSKGASRTGVLYEDAKGRRELKFQGEDGGKWDVRPVTK
jgi:hypothetical protein